MFERILLSLITLASKLYLNIQLKKFSQIQKGGNYTMEITSKLGKLSFTATVKELNRIKDESGNTISSDPVDVANFGFSLEEMESTVLMDAEELRNCNEVGLEDMKLFYDKFLAPAGSRISGWMDRVVDNLEKEASDKRYYNDRLNEVEVDRLKRELNKAYPE
jgi:hypothetical protein